MGGRPGKLRDKRGQPGLQRRSMWPHIGGDRAEGKLINVNTYRIRYFSIIRTAFILNLLNKYSSYPTLAIHYPFTVSSVTEEISHNPPNTFLGSGSRLNMVEVS